MEFEEFKNKLMDMVSEEIKSREIEGVTLEHKTINSPDGMNERLMVSVEGAHIAMAFRLQEIYNSVENGNYIEDEVNHIVDTISNNIPTMESKEQDVKSFIMDYSKVKESTYLRLIPGNSPALEDTPHKMIEDMALVVNVHLDDFSDPDGKAVVIVNESLMKEYGIDADTLFADATKNSIENEPVALTPLGDMIKHLIESDNLPIPGDSGPIAYVASNKSGFQGAAIAGYPEFLESAASTIGGSFFMIPSSVHEFILIKDDGTPRAKEINKMIRNVNETVLDPREILSNQCYHYDAKTKVLETGVKFDKAKEKKAGVR